jgi:hypothetical protein
VLTINGVKNIGSAIKKSPTLGGERSQFENMVQPLLHRVSGVKKNKTQSTSVKIINVKNTFYCNPNFQIVNSIACRI